jgi:hypothetical protein
MALIFRSCGARIVARRQIIYSHDSLACSSLASSPRRNDLISMLPIDSFITCILHFMALFFWRSLNVILTSPGLQ